MEHKCLPKTILPPWYGCAHLAELEAEAWGGLFSCAKSVMGSSWVSAQVLASQAPDSKHILL